MADDIDDVDRSAKGDRITTIDTSQVTPLSYAPPPLTGGTTGNAFLDSRSHPELFDQLRRIAQTDQDEPLTDEEIQHEYPGLPEFGGPGLLPSDSETMSNEDVDTTTARRSELQKQDAGDAYRQIFPQRPVPAIPAAPQTPDSIVRHAIGAFANPLMLIAATAGALTKRPALNALAAATGVMEGLNERNWQKAYLQQHKFRNSVKETIGQQEREIADVDSILKSGAPMAEQQNLLDVVAQQNQDPVLSNLVRTNFGSVQAFNDGRRKALEGLHRARRGYGKAEESLAKEREGEFSKPDPIYEIEAQREAVGLPIGGRPSAKDQRRISGRANYIRTHPEQKIDLPQKPAAGEAKEERRRQDAESLAQGIIDGKIDPNLTGFYNLKAPTEAILSRRGFDLAGAKIDWARVQKQIAALNSERQNRLWTLARSVINTIDEVKNLAREREQGGIVALNALQLREAAQFESNTPKGQLAIRYITAINALKEEMAGIQNGGYAPTESVWDLVNNQINGNYGQRGLEASLNEIVKLMNIRLNAVPNVGTLGPAAPNRYVPQAPQEAPQPNMEGWH